MTPVNNRAASTVARMNDYATDAYAATKYGRHFLSGRFLKLTEFKNQKNMVFDKYHSEFISVEDAALEHLMESQSFRRELHAEKTSALNLPSQCT